MTTITIERGESGYHVKFRATDRTAFCLLVDSLKDFIHFRYRDYAPESRTCLRTTSATSSLRRWLEYASVHAHAGIQWQGESESDSSPHDRPFAGDPYEVLYLRSGAPLELIKSAHRILAKHFHPDVPGGCLDQMKRVNAAFDTIMKGMAA